MKGAVKIEQASVKDYLTVSALSQYISQKFERDPYLQVVRVVGEISNYRFRPNGHQYFALKEGDTVINAIMFRSQFQKVKFTLDEGMKVYVTARVGVYENGGRYQLYVQSIEPDGMGALYLAFEQLKKKMKEAGLLDLPKKPLHPFPKRLAIITSPNGSVIRDIITTIRRRYPIVELIVYPTRVQGNEAVQEIVSAFKQVHQDRDHLDGVILARGGGSIEDLWCFNEEAVAEAIISCSIPVISSIGHETDTTLADLVADLRAPTPTAAAELAVPVLREVLLRLNQLKEGLLLALHQRLSQFRDQLTRSQRSYVLTDPQRIYENKQIQLSSLGEKLRMLSQYDLTNKQQALKSIHQVLMTYHPERQLTLMQDRLMNQTRQVLRLTTQQIDRHKTQLVREIALLDAFSPLKVMQRGYAIIEHENQIITSSQSIEPGDQLAIQLASGRLQAKVTAVDHKEET